MLRFFPLALIALLLTPSALASGIASVAVGPDGVVDPAKEPYYLWVVVYEPSAPKDERAYDCGAGARTPLTQAGVGAVLAVARWDPREQPSASSWYPRCTAGDASLPCDPGMTAPPVAGCDVVKGDLHAAYDAPSGNYYANLRVRTNVTDALFPGTPPRASSAEVGIGGASGVGTQADCEYCPPPP